MPQTSRPFGFGRWRRELLQDVRGRVLELGCGWGSNFSHYPDHVRVLATDIELDRLRRAPRPRRSGPPIQLSAVDAQCLPFPDGYFDSVVGTLLFCSIPEPAPALSEIRRVLRQPGGRLYLIDHVRSPRPWMGALQDLLAPLWLAVTGGCHLNRTTEETVRAAGFKMEKVRAGWGGLLKLMIGSAY